MKSGPGSKDYGALSLAVQYYEEPYIVANVPCNCFYAASKRGFCSDSSDTLRRTAGSGVG